MDDQNPTPTGDGGEGQTTPAPETPTEGTPTEGTPAEGGEGSSM